MKKIRLLLSCLVLVLSLTLGFKVNAQQIYQGENNFYRDLPAYAPGEIVVDLKDDISMNDIQKIEKELSLDLQFVSLHSQEEKLMTALVPQDDMDSVLKKLKGYKEVEFAEPNYYCYTYSEKPNDPMYKYQWNLEKINLRKAWDNNHGEGVMVAVIDTGVAYQDNGKFHRLEDLNNTQFVKGYNFVDKNDYPLDDNAHGSHVAGTIAQTTNNRKGVAGIVYKAKIMPIKVLNARGYGKISDIADGIRYAADHNAKVINMSLGGPFPSLILESACNYAYGKGVVIICAAGNNSSTNIGYPAGYKNCVAVSATRYDDQLAPYSNRGKNITIAAPGGDTKVDQNGDGLPDGILQNTISYMNPSKEGYYLFQGTSMAAPHVAGVAALIYGSGVTDNKEVVRILKETARKEGLKLETGYGAGIVDAGAAVRKANVNLGWLKLLIALALLVLILVIIGMAKLRKAKVLWSPGLYAGLLLGGVGLFFLHYLRLYWLPGFYFATQSVPEWFSSYGRLNPIFFSCIIPIALAVFCYKTKFQKFAAGYSIGVASMLFFHLFGSSDVVWIPNLLDKPWLLFNFLICLFIGFLLLKLVCEEQQPQLTETPVITVGTEEEKTEKEEKPQ